jgi:hypothetical protein
MAIQIKVIRCLFLAFALLHAAVDAKTDCGKQGVIIGKVNDKEVKLKTRVFSDGSIAVRAPLAVNPDGGPASYTQSDHGFTYIANGLALWRNGKRIKCDSECVASFKSAEKADFATGTAEFCVFAMEVEPLTPNKNKLTCKDGYVIGNGKGRPVSGELLESVTGEKIQTYASTTSLQHTVGGKVAPLNSETLPVAVSPRVDLLGKVLWVKNSNAKIAFAIIGDKGPAFGEGSIALHQLLRQGSIQPQKIGPIPVAQRCQASETELLPPFQSNPDAKKDQCRTGYLVKSNTDIRAYNGIAQSLDFVVLGSAEFQRTGRTIKTEVTIDSIKALTEQSGYTSEKIDRMISCLRE